MKKKLLIATGMITIIILLTILQGKVNAATLQSNPNTHYKNEWKSSIDICIKDIRKMEASGGAMGLSEMVNDDQTFKEKSNNIDVHMMKNTEYGAIAILSVSGYGNSKIIPKSTIKSTTGNKTGVYYTTTGNNDLSHGEWTASGIITEKIQKINSRYYEQYGKNKIGDALDLKWQGSSVTGYISSSPNLKRNFKGYFGMGDNTRFDVSTAFIRGVAVCGTGF